MALGTILIACPFCSRHAFARESHCPGCGSALRAPDGSLQRTAGAAFLGLTIALTVACSSETGGGTTTGAGGGSSSASGSGMGGFQTMSTYGVGPSSGNSSSSSSSTGGVGGTGGAGGAGGAGGSK